VVSDFRRIQDIILLHTRLETPRTKD